SDPLPSIDIAPVELLVPRPIVPAVAVPVPVTMKPDVKSAAAAPLRLTFTAPTVRLPPLTRRVDEKSEFVRNVPMRADPPSITTCAVVAVTVPSVVNDPPVTLIRELRARFTALVPRANAPPAGRSTEPAFTFTVPVSVFAALRTRSPGPAFTSPAVPSSTAPTVALAPAPSALTVTVGAAPARVRVLPPPSRTQLAGVVTSMSPNVRVPTVRGPSMRTVFAEVRSSPAKLAARPTPSATTAPFQFRGSLQNPPLSRRIQVPSPTLGVTSVYGSPAAYPFSSTPLPSTMPLPATRSRRIVPVPADPPTVTSKIDPAPDDTAVTAPAAVPVVATAKAPVVTPLTAWLKVTRKTTFPIVFGTTAKAGVRRTMATRGAPSRFKAKTGEAGPAAPAWVAVA